MLFCKTQYLDFVLLVKCAVLLHGSWDLGWRPRRHHQQQPMPAAPLRSATADAGRGSIALVALRERTVT